MTWFYRFKSFYQGISVLLIISCLTWGLPVNLYAQQVTPLDRMPAPREFVHLTQSYNPPALKGIQIVPNNPFRFNFIIEQGDEPLNKEAFRSEAYRLVKYFMASLTIPEKDLWVNLSPYEHNRIITPEFAVTEMGRDLLAQDYVLKQLTSSLIYPEADLGKKFWERVYQHAWQRYGRTDIPINTFNKVWIAPKEAIVYEKNGGAFIAYTHLKVMLEEDYLASQKNNRPMVVENPLKSGGAAGDNLAKGIVREIILPEIEKEVNEGKNFARLRQIFNAIVLATWFKNNLKESLLDKIYANQKKVNGIDLVNRAAKETIYRNYLLAYKKGVYNFIKEDSDIYSHQIVPRKYFSGGFWAEGTSAAMVTYQQFSQMPMRAQLGLEATGPSRKFTFEMRGKSGNSNNAMRSVGGENRKHNLTQLEHVVRDTKGPGLVLAVTNGGDEGIVKQQLQDDVTLIFNKKSGRTHVLTYPMVKNRGQLLVILDAVRMARHEYPADMNRLVVLIPGNGTRMNPFTLRELGN